MSTVDRLGLALDRRQLLRLFGAAAAVGVTGVGASACSTAEPVGTGMEQPNGQTLSIGLLAPAVGPLGRIGDDITKGFKLYLSDHDNLLGLYNVDLHVVEEGGGAIGDATRAAKSLIDAKVSAIVGVANPAALTAIAPMADSSQTVVISTSTAPATVTSEWVWRAASVEGEAGTALSGYARTVGPKAYVLADPGSTAQAEVAGFTRGFTNAGGTIAGTSNGTDGFGSLIGQAESSGADTIFAAHTGDAAAALLTAYRSSGASARLIAPASLTENIDLTKVGALPRTVYTSAFYAADLDNEDNRRFVSAFQNTHGVAPTSLAMAAYDGAALLDKALRLVQGDLSSAKLRDAFKILGQINSPRGTWAFNVDRGPQQTWYLRKLRLDGQVPANMLDSDLAVLS